MLTSPALAYEDKGVNPEFGIPLITLNEEEIEWITPHARKFGESVAIQVFYIMRCNGHTYEFTDTDKFIESLPDNNIVKINYSYGMDIRETLMDLPCHAGQIGMARARIKGYSEEYFARRQQFFQLFKIFCSTFREENSKQVGNRLLTKIPGSF